MATTLNALCLAFALATCCCAALARQASDPGLPLPAQDPGRFFSFENDSFLHPYRYISADWDRLVWGAPGHLAFAERRHAIDALSFDLGHHVHLTTASYWRMASGHDMHAAAGGIALIVGRDMPAGVGSCVAPWLQCTAFGALETRGVDDKTVIDARLFPDGVLQRRGAVHDAVMGMRFDFPRTRSAGHGPWFIQFKASRRSPEIKSWMPIPKHRVMTLTIGTEF